MAGLEQRHRLDVRSVPLRGVHLIEASAGTGKTYTITSLILRLLVEREIPIEKILAVTFTTAATSELKSRVERRLAAARRHLLGELGDTKDEVFEALGAIDRQRALLLIERALGSMDRAAIFTIHGFAGRALSESAFESGVPLELEVIADEERLAHDAALDFWAEHIAWLPSDRFAELGGFRLYGELVRTARIALINREMPIVELDPPSVLERIRKGIDAEVRAAFERAASLFAVNHQELERYLSSGVVNKRTYRSDTIAKDSALWAHFFSSNDAFSTLPEDDERWTADKARERAVGGRSPSHPLLDAIGALRRSRALLADHIALEKASLLRACIEGVQAKVTAEHARARTRSFDDLLLSLRRALLKPDAREPGCIASVLEGRYQVALIDEFQDTDPIQYDIFREIFARRREPALFLIGDPKQSIYAFRGADVLAYLKAGRDAASGHWTLDRSYRSSPSVVRAQNTIFEPVRKPFGIEGIVYDTISANEGREDELFDSAGRALPGGVVLTTPESRRGGNVPLVAQLIVERLNSGETLAGRPLSPRNFAVLCRTNAQALEAQRALAELRVPAVMHGDRSVFESREARSLRRVLLALVEPGQRRLVRTAMVTELIGVDARGLEELDEGGEALELWDRRFHDFSHAWRDRGFFYAMDLIFRELDVAARLLSEPGGERSMTNFRHLIELLHAAEAEEHLGMLGLLKFLEMAIADPWGHAMAAEARQLRLESDADAVVLTTIHKSKGLEYDIVLLPTLGDADEPFAEPVFRVHDEEGAPLVEVRPASLCPSNHITRAKEHYAEVLRVAYVGLTRARHQFVCLLGPPPSSGFSPLHYFLTEPRALLSELGEVKALMESLSPLHRDELLRGWQSVSNGSLEVAVHSLVEGRTPYRSIVFDAPLAPQPFIKSVLDRLAAGPRTSSFSALTRTSGEIGRQARAGRDVDERDVGRFLEGRKGGGARSALADFPRGARAGEALHALFEVMPFERSEALQRRAATEKILEGRGLGRNWVESVDRAVDDLLTAPLVPLKICLADVDIASRAAEMEFNLLVGAGGARLSAKRLGAALRTFSCLPSRALDDLAHLEFSEFSGYLRGFIDLTFEHEGKVYVVDYKSNYLGESYDDYHRLACEQSMIEHHYYLQGSLYGLAVHRQAMARDPEYSYERNFGGIFYLFVRGMTPVTPGAGVHFFRPEKSEMDALGHALEGS